VPGVKKEWWCHTPSNTWFIAERDTERDVVIRTYLYGEAP
jgi:sarcosine oxidase subunit delta